MSNKFDIPHGLIDAIKQGNCVAFVGAGFSVPAGMPGWGKLLSNIIEKVDPDHPGEATYDGPKLDKKLIQFLKDKVKEANEKGNAELYDLVAQLLEDNLTTDDKKGSTALEELVNEQLKIPDDKEMPPAMMERLELLKSIPFRAILTTNFDLLMKGPTPWTTSSTEEDYKYPYSSVLRPRNMTDDDMKFSLDPVIKHHMEGVDQEHKKGAFIKQLQLITQKDKPVIKIHGTLQDSNGDDRSLVFTRDGYRKLIHSTPGYSNFLKSLLSTSTVLYIGFSFSDGYLNELRGEVISMLYGESKGIRNVEPIGYAIINDKSTYELKFFKDHEGVQILPFSTYVFDDKGNNVKDEKGNDARDFTGLERYLKKLRDLSSFSYHIGKSTYGKKVLLLDYVTHSNETTAPSPTKQTEGYADKKKNEVIQAAATNWKMVGGDLVPLLEKSIESYVKAMQAAGDENFTAKKSVYSFGSVEDCLEALRKTESEEEPFDAIITIFGEDKENGKHLWKTLVDGMRSLNARAQTPFIVYSSSWNFEARRKYCLGHGAFDCVDKIQNLMNALTKILEKPEKPNPSTTKDVTYDYF